MEVRYVLFALFFLVACGNSPTGEVVAENPLASDLEAAQAQVADLEAQVADLEAAVVSAQNAQAVAETDYNELLEAYETAQNTISQQKVVLKDMDNERLKAVEDSEGCDERIDNLETSNAKLQNMLDICQEDLS